MNNLPEEPNKNEEELAKREEGSAQNEKEQAKMEEKAKKAEEKARKKEQLEKEKEESRRILEEYKAEKKALREKKKAIKKAKWKASSAFAKVLRITGTSLLAIILVAAIILPSFDPIGKYNDHLMTEYQNEFYACERFELEELREGYVIDKASADEILAMEKMIPMTPGASIFI